MLLVSIIAAISLHIYALTMVSMGERSLRDVVTNRGQWSWKKTITIQVIWMTLVVALLYCESTRLPILIWGLSMPVLTFGVRKEAEKALDTGDADRLFSVLKKGLAVSGVVFLVCLVLFFGWVLS